MSDAQLLWVNAIAESTSDTLKNLKNRGHRVVSSVVPMAVVVDFTWRSGYFLMRLQGHALENK